MLELENTVRDKERHQQNFTQTRKGQSKINKSKDRSIKNQPTEMKKKGGKTKTKKEQNIQDKLTNLEALHFMILTIFKAIIIKPYGFGIKIDTWISGTDQTAQK